MAQIKIEFYNDASNAFKIIFPRDWKNSSYNLALADLLEDLSLFPNTGKQVTTDYNYSSRGI